MSLSLQALGRVAIARAEPAEAAWLLGESLAIAREIGDRWLEAQALGCLGELAASQGNRALARERRRAALAVAAAAPLPIALDEAAALATLELEDQPAAALAALAYVRSHPLTRPAARAAAEQRWNAAARHLPAEHLAAAQNAAASLPADRPAALLELLQP